MKSFSLFFVSIIFIFFISVCPSYSQTIIPGGYVSGTWTGANSPYQINGDITVHTDSALTIEPGVEVIFQGHYRFIINGIINAVGTQTDSIRFTAAIPDTGWRGLRFMMSADTSYLAYCIIEYGKSTGGNIYDKRGGGIFCQNSQLKISHCSIRNNLAERYGGGICFDNVLNDTIFITDCDITNNSTTGSDGDGGGIYFRGGLFVEMQNCIVSHNLSTNGRGGGIFIGMFYSNINVLRLSNCNVTYNQAGIDGGGIWTEGPNWNELYITQSDISYNTAVNNGGGIYTQAIVTGGSYTGTFIDSSSFIGNEVTGALGKGGAIYGDLYCWPYIGKTIENTIIADNQAFEGGGLYLFQSNAYFDKCTIADNTGTTGSGLYFSSSNIHIKNSILSLNSPAAIHNDATILYLNYSDFYGNGINISGGVPAGFGQLVTTNYNGDSCDVGYNIFLDPLFEDPGSGNYQITWTNWPTPDSTKSPCIDAGDPTSPLDPDNTISDMGTFYFHQPGSHIQPGYVSGTWFAANSPYFINGDITIHADSALNIEPGVEVIFNGHYKFNVEGIISAVGTENDSIYFTAADPNTGWWGLRFTNAADGSQLSYCIFQYGRATGGLFLDKRGGAIFVRSSRPQISHCTISNNIAEIWGGGIYVDGTTTDPFPQISYCTIANNSALGSNGGGISFNAGSFDITDCIISGNTAEQSGGGLYIASGATDTVNISNCIISNDSSSGYGGGIYVVDGYTFIDGCTITGNKAGLTGGGLYSGGDLSLTNSTVQENISWGGTVNYEIGGGGFIAYKSTFVDNCIIAGNISHTGSYPSYGGGFLLRQVNSAEITNSKILNNSADIAGGMMFTANNVTLAYCEISNNQALLGVNGGAQIQSDNSSIDHCTVSGNVGGGLYVNNDADISNSIFSWNSPNALILNESPTITYSDFFANDQDIIGSIPPGFGVLDTTNINGDSCDVYSNLFLDPLFADTSISDFHLTENSPCIDAGDPTSPLDPDGTITDMGAFSFDQSALVFEKEFFTGWNLVGLPLEVENPNYQILFPTSIPGTLFGYNIGYYSTDTLEIGTGYWLKFPGPGITPISGTPILPPQSVELIAGWNMISGLSCNIAISDIGDPGSIIIPGTLYGYGPGYYSADSIKQGNGYWVKTSSAGYIDLSCTTELSKSRSNLAGNISDLSSFGRIEISDNSGSEQTLYFDGILEDETNLESFSLPPLPPEGSFDARLSGGYRVAETDEVLIQIQSSNYPLSIKVEGLAHKGAAKYIISELIGNEKVQEHSLFEGEEILISDSKIKLLKISKQQLIPIKFELSQNYPNPFNPITTIKFAVAKESDVNLSIYNVLGELVSTLVNEELKPGYYEYDFNASILASGVYLYRISAGDFVETKKMVLLK